MFYGHRRTLLRCFDLVRSYMKRKTSSFTELPAGLEPETHTTLRRSKTEEQLLGPCFIHVPNRMRIFSLILVTSENVTLAVTKIWWAENQKQRFSFSPPSRCVSSSRKPSTRTTPQLILVSMTAPHQHNLSQFFMYRLVTLKSASVICLVTWSGCRWTGVVSLL